MVSGPVGRDEREGIYIVSVIGSTIRLLRENAREAAVSHDGTKIAFADADHRQIWVMDADGQQSRPVVTAGPDYSVGWPKWSNDGRRLSYFRIRPSADVIEQVLETCNPDGSGRVALLNDNSIGDYDWLSGGRVVVARTEPPPHSADSNLWEIRVDTSTGQPKSQLRRLSDWTGVNFQGLNLTGDGKQLVFTNYRPQSDVYIAELDGAGQPFKSAERLTLDERLDWPSAWTHDSKTVLFHSDRAGAFDLYQQGVQARTADVLVINAEQKWSPELSPDGAWILYLSRVDQKSPARLMRMAAAGGSSEVVFDLRGSVDFAIPTDISSTDHPFPSFHCGTQPSAGCVVAERLGSSIVFSRFDPAKGSKSEVMTFKPDHPWVQWDLSPDGSRLAVNTFFRDKGDLRIVTLADGRITLVPIKDVARLGGVSWAADSSGLYLPSFSSRGTTILFATLDGTNRMVYKSPWDIFSTLPSPDGRHIALGTVTTNSNVWLIPKFPKD